MLVGSAEHDQDDGGGGLSQGMSILPPHALTGSQSHKLLLGPSTSPDAIWLKYSLRGVEE